MRILSERPIVKSYYRTSNSETLLMNNELSIKLIKDLCRLKTHSNNEFIEVILKVLRRIETLQVPETRKKILKGLTAYR